MIAKSIEYKTNTENYSYQAVELVIDGEVKGFIEVSSDCIEMVEVDSDVRGNGFYTSLIQHALILTNLDTLRSNNRNSDSNAIWEHWIGEELDCEDECYVTLEHNGLDFFYSLKPDKNEQLHTRTNKRDAKTTAF